MDDKRYQIRSGRVDSILKEIVSRFLLEEANKDTFITISHIDINSAGTIANVYCSVFPVEKSAIY